MIPKKKSGEFVFLIIYNSGLNLSPIESQPSQQVWQNPAAGSTDRIPTALEKWRAPRLPGGFALANGIIFVARAGCTGVNTIMSSLDKPLFINIGALQW